MKHTHVIITGTLLIVLVWVFLFCATYMYPMVADDYILRYIFNEDRLVGSVADAVYSQSNVWMRWSGRVVSFFLIQSFLLLERCWYSIAIVIAYATTCIVLSRLVSRQHYFRTFILVSLSLWLLMPTPNSTMFWLSGGFNYTFPVFLSMLFLGLAFSGNKKWQVIAIPLGIIAGNGQETVSLAISAALVLYAIVTPRKSYWFYACVTSYVIGFLLNASAPGNFARLASKSPEVDDFTSIVLSYVKNFMKVGYRLFFNTSELRVLICTAMWIASAVLCLKLKKRGDKTYIVPACILFGALATLSINVASGTAVPRSIYGYCFLSYAAFIYMLVRALGKKYAYLFLSAAFIMNIVCVPQALRDIHTLNLTMKYVKEAAHNQESIVQAAPGWENLNQSPFVQRMIGSCVLDNDVITRYYGIQNLSVLPYNDVETLKNHKEELRSLPLHSTTCLDNRLYIVRLTELPKKVDLIVNSSLPANANAWDKLQHWIDKHRFKDKQCYIIYTEGSYWAYWTLDKGQMIQVKYNEKPNLNIPI